MAKKNVATDPVKTEPALEEPVVETTDEVVVPAPKAEEVHEEEAVSEYTIEELAAGAESAFGCMPEMVMAALMEQKVTKCSKAEAAKLVEAFKKKEVK